MRESSLHGCNICRQRVGLDVLEINPCSIASVRRDKFDVVPSLPLTATRRVALEVATPTRSCNSAPTQTQRDAQQWSNYVADGDMMCAT